MLVVMVIKVIDSASLARVYAFKVGDTVYYLLFAVKKFRFSRLTKNLAVTSFYALSYYSRTKFPKKTFGVAK